MANYAIKPTPEQALRSDRTLPPARLIAALAFITKVPANCEKGRVQFLKLSRFSSE
jgi:hypothetical protein